MGPCVASHPEDILEDIRALPGFRNLQLGIVSFDAPLATWFFPNGPDFPGSMGQLDGAGRAEARLVLDPTFSASIVGERFHFAAYLTGVVTFPVLP